MTEPEFRWCAACRRPRPLVDLLKVSPTDDRDPWFVCRPSASNGVCFSSVVPSRQRALIALAER